MNRHILLVAIMASLLIVKGCQNHHPHTFVEVSSIPDQTYDVTVHERFMSRSYAVLFDIPDDDMEVFMKNTSFTKRIGKDSPREYVERFNSRIKYYRTVRIEDQKGTVRGYLMVSAVLNYWIGPVGDRIMVDIETDPNF